MSLNRAQKSIIKVVGIIMIAGMLLGSFAPALTVLFAGK